MARVPWMSIDSQPIYGIIDEVVVMQVRQVIVFSPFVTHQIPHHRCCPAAAGGHPPDHGQLIVDL